MLTKTRCQTEREAETIQMKCAETKQHLTQQLHWVTWCVLCQTIVFTADSVSAEVIIKNKRCDSKRQLVKHLHIITTGVVTQLFWNHMPRLESCNIPSERIIMKSFEARWLRNAGKGKMLEFFTSFCNSWLLFPFLFNYHSWEFATRDTGR